MAESALEGFVERVFGGEDPLLRSAREEAEAAGLPTIQVPLELGRLLEVLISAAGVKDVLEIGTLYGYSAVTMARALPAGGRVVTLEVEPKHAKQARLNFDRAGVSGMVTLMEGPAIRSLDQLAGQTFGLVFIDADKRSYPEYLRRALAMTRTGSIIVADNVWRRGEVASAEDDSPDNAGIVAFLEALASNSALVTSVVPRFGCTDAASLSVVRRKPA